jgi:hypothetical protein
VEAVAMSFGDLRHEYERERVGPLILERIRAVVSRTARRYPPTVYAEVASAWDDDNLGVLIQDFVAGSLLAQGQLDYTMSVATSLSDFDALTARQLRRHLRQGRRRTIVDNLVDRARAIVRETPFTTLTGPTERYTLAGVDIEDREVKDADLVDAVRVASLIPREVSGARERAARVYKDDDLARLVSAIARALRCPFTLDHVRHVLERVLTELAPSHLQSLSDDSGHADDAARVRTREAAEVQALRDEGGDLMAVPELAPEGAALAGDAVARYTGALAGRDRTILRLKWSGASDTDVAAAVGLSRPTVADRKRHLITELESELSGLDAPTQRRVLDDIGRFLAEGVDDA